MDRQDPSSASGGRPSGRRCAGCGQPLTEHEDFVSDTCERCERDFLAGYDVDGEFYPRAA